MVLLVSSMVLFPCFYSIVVIHRNRNFFIAFPLFHACFTRSWSHIGASIFPLFFHPINFHPFTCILLGIIFQAFYSNFPLFSHCFIWYSLICSIVFLIIFPSIAVSPSPDRRTDQGESIPHRHPIATWYITLKKLTSVRLFYHLISWFSSR